jgi:hypothetical protein
MDRRRDGSQMSLAINFIKEEAREGRGFRNNREMRARIHAAIPTLRTAGIGQRKYAEWALFAQYELAAENVPLFITCPIPEFSYEREPRPRSSKGRVTLLSRQRQTLTRLKHERLLLKALCTQFDATESMRQGLDQLSLAIVVIEGVMKTLKD